MATPSSSPEEERPPLKVAPVARATLEGKWILILTQNGTDFKAALLDFAKTPGGADSAGRWQATLLESTSVLPPVKLKLAELEGKSVHLSFSVADRDMDFRGALRDGTIWGNVLFSVGRCDPARLIATEEASLKNEKPYEEAPGLSDLKAALRSKQVEAIRDFCQRYPDSPLVLQAYAQLLSMAKEKGLSVDQVQEIAGAYVAAAERWGARLGQAARLNVGIILATSLFDPDVALRFLTEAEKQVDPTIRERMLTSIEAARIAARAQKGRLLLASSDKTKQAEGESILRTLRRKRPFDTAITYALAQYAERQGRKQEAIALFAELAVLPMAEQFLLREWSMQGRQKELPSETLARLWKEEHGSTEGLQEYLDKVYKERIYSFAEPPSQAAAPPNGHVVLCELFTGAQCPPCVAADIAVGGLEKTYPNTQLVVLRYHQHIPGPDPLANPDAEARFAYYNGPGTPMLVIDGTPVQGVGGFLPHVQDVYRRIRKPVETILAKPSEHPPIRIAVKAVAEKGKLHVSVKVDSAQKLGEAVRLRLVLAEDEVSFLAPNGVRFHEMIVRHMIGGADGVAPQNGRLAIDTTVDLAEMKQRLVDYLTNFERGRGFAFPARPLDLRPLHIVAFVQDDLTRKVLQTAIAPVTGSLKYPEVKTKAEPAAQESGQPTGKPAEPRRPSGEQTTPPDGTSQTGRNKQHPATKQRPSGPVLPPVNAPKKKE
ncbi:MAG TPA: hypothetical protein EYP14_02495 [Planctomycetaceae bacterium]|nr:hypothetical protein [Planctomycetaceae bacterium]